MSKELVEKWRKMAEECATVTARYAFDTCADDLESEIETDTEEYEVWQGDMCVAGVLGEGAPQDAKHYAMMYGQDGQVTIYRVTRKEIAQGDL